MRILAVCDHYLPGFKAGGPIRTLANMFEWLGEEFEFFLLTSDRDFKDLHPYPGIKPGVWQDISKGKVMYLTPRHKRIWGLCGILNRLDYDVLYLNSYFSRLSIKLVILQRLGLIGNKPTILAPRGEFSKGALALKWLKKKIYITIVNRIKLYKGIVWQASSEYEKQDILAAFGKANSEQLFPVHIASDLPSSSIMIAPNLPEIKLMSGEKNTSSKSPNVVRIVFISRISRKKNLDYALRVLKEVKGEVAFDIYGPLEDGKYWGGCQSLIADLPSNIRVAYKGEVDPRDVVDVFSKYHLFFFPTRGENFGHVILESLCGGCPVLLSDQTPWRGLVDEKAGWDLPLSKPEAFLAALSEMIAMDETTFKVWSGSARKCGVDFTTDPGLVEANRLLFLRPHLISN